MKKVIKFALTLLIICLVNVVTFSLNVDENAVDILGNNKLIIVKGNLNNKNVYFLLDTGSGLTILNSKNSKRYNFSLSSSTIYSIVGFNGKKGNISRVNRANLEIGQLKIIGDIYSTDINHIVSNVKLSTGFYIVGIIGADIMYEYDFMIDYKNKKVFFAR
ncbi:MAG: aspartyl protease family protein [bacterium]